MTLPASQTISVESAAAVQAIDVTDQLMELDTGSATLAHASMAHTSAALVIGPGDDGMLADYVSLSSNWLAGLRPFKHIENDNPNGEAHLLSSILGVTLLLPADSGRLTLGRWQRVLLLEFDGPATRRVNIRYL